MAKKKIEVLTEVNNILEKSLWTKIKEVDSLNSKVALLNRVYEGLVHVESCRRGDLDDLGGATPSSEHQLVPGRQQPGWDHSINRCVKRRPDDAPETPKRQRVMSSHPDNLGGEVPYGVDNPKLWTPQREPLGQMRGVVAADLGVSLKNCKLNGFEETFRATSCHTNLQTAPCPRSLETLLGVDFKNTSKELQPSDTSNELRLADFENDIDLKERTPSNRPEFDDDCVIIKVDEAGSDSRESFFDGGKMKQIGWVSQAERRVTVSTTDPLPPGFTSLDSLRVQLKQGPFCVSPVHCVDPKSKPDVWKVKDLHAAVNVEEKHKEMESDLRRVNVNSTGLNQGFDADMLVDKLSFTTGSNKSDHGALPFTSEKCQAERVDYDPDLLGCQTIWEDKPQKDLEGSNIQIPCDINLQAAKLDMVTEFDHYVSPASSSIQNPFHRATQSGAYPLSALPADGSDCSVRPVNPQRVNEACGKVSSAQSFLCRAENSDDFPLTFKDSVLSGNSDLHLDAEKCDGVTGGDMASLNVTLKVRSAVLDTPSPGEQFQVGVSMMGSPGCNRPSSGEQREGAEYYRSSAFACNDSGSTFTSNSPSFLETHNLQSWPNDKQLALPNCSPNKELLSTETTDHTLAFALAEKLIAQINPTTDHTLAFALAEELLAQSNPLVFEDEPMLGTHPSCRDAKSQECTLSSPARPNKERCEVAENCSLQQESPAQTVHHSASSLQSLSWVRNSQDIPVGHVDLAGTPDALLEDDLIGCSLGFDNCSLQQFSAAQTVHHSTSSLESSSWTRNAQDSPVGQVDLLSTPGILLEDDLRGCSLGFDDFLMETH